MKAFFGLLVWGVFSAIALTGWSESHQPPVKPPPPYVNSLRIVMAISSDTIRFLPGDSTSVNGYAEALDGDQSVPGATISMRLAQTNGVA